MPEEAKNTRNSTRKILKSSPSADPFLEHGKLPPQAVELEEAVLGALMLDKDALTAVIDILHPKVFYKESHQRIYEAIQNLFSKSDPIDILTVTNQLKTNGHLELVGGPYYISQLTNRVASAANVEFHARILLQKFVQRELIRLSTEIIKEAYEDTSDVFDLLDKAESNLFEVSETNLRRQYASMEMIVKEAVKEIEAARDHKDGVSGVQSGFTALDRITSGWQKSDLIILASRPGMGKTAFALTLARNAAVAFNRGVAIFSLEMSAVQLVTRLIAAETKLTSDKLRKGNLEGHEWTQLTTRIQPLIEAPIFIDDTPALSVFELRAKCRRLKSQHDIQMVIIDYLQLMTGSTQKQGTRENEISQISRSLKTLAKELNVPVLALSQLSRAVETRAGSKKPILSDLRESGAIEQDADMVLFIYRPEYYKFDDASIPEGKAEIGIAKHRNGALADVELRFVAEFAKFIEPDDPEYTGGQRKVENEIMTFQSKMNEDFSADADDIPY